MTQTGDSNALKRETKCCEQRNRKEGAISLSNIPFIGKQYEKSHTIKFLF